MAFLVPTLVTLRDQLNANNPSRDKSSDGWIGDVAHSSRVSDHNPNSAGEVRALDADHDGLVPSAQTLFDTVLAMGKARDSRVYPHGYAIYRGRITNPDFNASRVYTGSNPHNGHCHVSSSSNRAGYNRTDAWPLPVGGGAPAPAPVNPASGVKWDAVEYTGKPGTRTISLGARGTDVAALQRVLNAWYPSLPRLIEDGDFGHAVAERVLHFQTKSGLQADRVVGPASWSKLGYGSAAPAPKPPADPTPWLRLPDMKRGQKAPHIEHWQRWFNDEPFKPALLPVIRPTDQTFGPKTEKAIRQVQGRYGLTADGIVGPRTKRLFWDLGWRP